MTLKVYALNLVLLACGAALASADRAVLQATALAAGSTGKCTIDPSKTQLDFSSVATSCSAAADVCGTCVCSLVDVFSPALVAGGVTYNPAAPDSFDIATASAIIRACAEEYVVAMLALNINVSALASLSQCNFSDAKAVPSCLANEVSQLSAQNVTAAGRVEGADTTYGVDDLSNITLPAPGAGASTLRIATVQSTPAGPQFTLAGTLTSAGQLLKAMAASSELTSAMAPEQATQLQALAADPSKVDANPGTAAVLNALENPVDGVKLLSQLAALNTEAASSDVAAATGSTPATAAAAPAAAAPAPSKSSAAARGMAATATIGATLLAAILL